MLKATSVVNRLMSQIKNNESQTPKALSIKIEGKSSFELLNFSYLLLASATIKAANKNIITW